MFIMPLKNFPEEINHEKVVYEWYECNSRRLFRYTDAKCYVFVNNNDRYECEEPRELTESEKQFVQEQVKIQLKNLEQAQKDAEVTALHWLANEIGDW